MTAQNLLKEKVAAINADLIENDFNPYDSSYEVELWAPEGKQWAANGAAFMSGMYWSYVKGSKEECYNDLLQRLEMGTEELDHEL